MNRETLHNNLLEVFKRKIPDNGELVDMLMNLLFMEKGAIYRRLRGEVPFSFYEVVKISEKLNIPINTLIYSSSERVDHFKMNIKSNKMDNIDYKHWEDYVAMIRSVKKDPNSEIAESSNVLPLSIYPGFDSLLKYFLFKYQYLNSGTDSRVTFSNLVVPERLYNVIKGYYHESRYFAKTIFIWDELIFQYLVNDIRYFSSINLISNDDVIIIKNDLFALMEYIEKMAINGCFAETGKQVLLYKSDVNLDAIYSYMQFNEMDISLARLFILNSVVSTVKSSFEIMKKWIQSLIKSSVLITQSGALFRAELFDKQRKIISEL